MYTHTHTHKKKRFQENYQFSVRTDLQEMHFKGPEMNPMRHRINKKFKRQATLLDMDENGGVK